MEATPRLLLVKLKLEKTYHLAYTNKYTAPHRTLQAKALQNPVGTILSGAMLCVIRFGLSAEAEAIESAVNCFESRRTNSRPYQNRYAFDCAGMTDSILTKL